MHEELKNLIAESMKQRSELEQKLITKAWEDETFKQELMSNPKAVLAREYGQELPEDLEVEVIQETSKKVYLILPENPTTNIEEAELSEQDLEAVAGGVSIDVCIWPSIRVRSGEKCIAWSRLHNANNLV